MPDYKKLCAELVDDLELCDWPYKLKETIRADIDRARDALTEPEPEGLTDKEIMELLPQKMRDELSPAAQEVLGDTHYEWELEDDEGEWQAGGSANSLQDVQREGMRYLQTYAQQGFHKLIIRQHCTKVIQVIDNG